MQEVQVLFSFAVPTAGMFHWQGLLAQARTSVLVANELRLPFNYVQPDARRTAILFSTTFGRFDGFAVLKLLLLVMNAQ